MKPDPIPRSTARRLRRGFTLLELLVASALTAAIATLALGLMANALSRWNRAQGTLTTEGQARVVLDQLALDLQGACGRNDGQVWLAASLQADTSASGAWVTGGKPAAASLASVAGELADARFGRAGVWLRFFAAASRAGQPAAPVAIGYQIIRRAPTPSGQECHYLLYRSEVGPAETFAAGYDLSGPSYAVPGSAAGAVAAPGIRQVLADNVVDFGVRFLAPVADPATGRPVLQQIFPRNGGELEYRAGGRDVGEGYRAFPEAVDVMVRVLTDEGARQIAALEAGRMGGDWWTIVEAHSRVFTRRVLVRANPGLIMLRRNDTRLLMDPEPRQGFALVLTLGLLAFLLLLLLSLATLTRVETSISTNVERQEQARQNAVMALQIALGRLQKFAGPDTRVTATAEAFGGGPGNRRFTGVWDAGTPGPAPLTWLVSGNEGTNPLAVFPGDTTADVELVGVTTSGVANDVRAPLQSIIASAVPGQSGSVATGHFAWWVGDQGVKAAVARTDRPDATAAAPGEQSRWIRQQIGFGAGPADSTGTTVFEPRDAANLSLASRVIDFRQLAFLRLPGEVSAVGAELVRDHFHSWSAGNEAVLAMTNPGGLRRDLSANPGLLGPAFAAWADYARYMEDPTAPVEPRPSPAYRADQPREALRRRYRLTAPVAASGLTHGVAPVLSYFLITFNVRTDQTVSGNLRPLEIRARWLASFWNPYTSSLVPEDLLLEVSGLPVVQVINDTTGATVSQLALDALYGAPLRIGLAWKNAGRDDQQSWLPGRVYTWAAQENLNKTAPVPGAGFASIFYTRTLSTAAGQGVQRAGSAAVAGNSMLLRLQGAATQLTLRLYRNVAGGGRELLRTHVSPEFGGFVTTPAPASAATYQFSYVFHLAESADLPAAPETWLSTTGQDPREPLLPPGSFLPGPNGPRPELYPNYTAIAFPDRLLDRALPASASSTTGQSYNEDAPLFELPRGPVLSIGELQHVPVAGGRPFAIGNSWGQPGGWNGLFDRYFFSGLAAAAVSPDSATPDLLPNPLLRRLPRLDDSGVPALADLRAEAGTGYTAKFLLQGGAFNLNSVDPLAWLAVLRSGRLVAGMRFAYLAANPATGTQADEPAAESALGESVFYRFPFSAQETYRADPGYAASTTVPPSAPNLPSPANTHLFRRGVRVLSPEQTVALAQEIVALMRQRLTQSGPFRTLEEFLGPSSQAGGPSLLETAIADAVPASGPRINDPSIVPEFSSQWLTQGDILSLLAPVLFVRSDTFLVRAYGDSVNPATGDIEGRAWCEATVQRLPEFVDSSEPAESLPAVLNPTNQAYGRRFQVVTFRWLTSADI